MNCRQYGMNCIESRMNGIAEMKRIEKLAMTITLSPVITVNK
jgi:hypothetical protein